MGAEVVGRETLTAGEAVFSDCGFTTLSLICACAAPENNIRPPKESARQKYLFDKTKTKTPRIIFGAWLIARLGSLTISKLPIEVKFQKI
jgi:hypothetical protein